MFPERWRKYFLELKGENAGQKLTDFNQVFKNGWRFIIESKFCIKNYRYWADLTIDCTHGGKEITPVVKNPSGGWSVEKSGASRASGTFKTQRDAVSSAKKISQNQGAKVVVHGRGGRIKKSDVSRFL